MQKNLPSLTGRVIRVLLPVLPGLAALILFMLPLTVLAESGKSEQLTNALALQHNGQYEEAIDALESYIPNANKEKPEAIYALAECYEQIGDYASAANAWRVYSRVAPNSQERGVALFRWANAVQSGGNPSLAAVIYRLFLSWQPDTQAKSEVLLRIARCYLDSNRPERAVPVYQEVLKTISDPQQRLEVIFYLSDAQVLQGQPTEALSLFTQEEANIPAAMQPGFQFRWALAERAAGQEQAGLNRLMSVFTNYPSSSFAHNAAVALLEAGQTLDEYQRGLVNYHADVYDLAIAAFDRYIQAGGDSRIASAYYYKGLSQRSLGQYDAAIATLDTLINNYPQDTLVPQARLNRGEILARQNNSQAASDTYIALADAHPAHELAPEALLRAGKLQETLSQADTATSLYDRLAQSYPQSNQAAEAGFRAGLMRWRAGNQADAEARWRQAVSSCNQCSEANRYNFWLARSLLAQGKQDEGMALLQQVAAASADYYTYRAHVLLDGKDLVSTNNNANLLLTENEAERREAEQWLTALSGGVWQPGTVPAAIAQDKRYLAMQEYWRLGLKVMAVDLLSTLSREYQNNAVVQYSLTLWARERGLYRLAIQCAAIITYQQANTPTYIWKMSYPTYYGDLVLKEASEWEVDPLLFFSMMRQESLFDASIGSHAGAQGLAQVMPATGSWIAMQLGDSDYSDADLLRPYISVRYGIYYISRQLNGLGGNTMAALAAYNAGPGSAANWLSLAGNDPDLFYETIAFSETRRYLSAILTNYRQYAHLYRSGG